jgi:hypothetical protein
VSDDRTRPSRRSDESSPDPATATAPCRGCLRSATSEFWTFGTAKGEVKADAQGRVTVPGLKITAEPTTLSVVTAM